MMEGGKSKSRANQPRRKKRFEDMFGLDPNMPRAPDLPVNDFFYFVDDYKEEFEKQFMGNPPPKTTMLFDLLEAAQAKWDTMNDVDKAPYVKMAEKSLEDFEVRRQEYCRNMTAFNKNRLATKRAAAAAARAAKEADKEGSEEARRNLGGLTIRD